MSRIELTGVEGSNPLGFMAALGLLRLVPDARLGFTDDGTFRAYLDAPGLSDTELAARVFTDAASSAHVDAPWRFTYTKAATKKKAETIVADLKPPPEAFKKFLVDCVEKWAQGEGSACEYAAAYGTDVATDGKGNTKPTAFHFTAANQTFLGAVESIRASLDDEWVYGSLFEGFGDRVGSNLRWDPNSERNWALMAHDPSRDGTLVNAPLEWLAFRGLPLLPVFPYGARVVTTGVTNRDGNTSFTWPLWTPPVTIETVRSVLHINWISKPNAARARGIFAICSSTIRRTNSGFGNFGPASVVG